MTWWRYMSCGHSDIAIASQMHQHLKQVITHLSTMRSHYNPPLRKKRALQGLTLQVCKRVWRSVDELQDILGQDRPKCWIFRHLYNHDVLITLPGCQTQSCSFDRDNSSKTKTKTPWPKTETKTSKNCLKAVLRQDTVSKLNITGKVPPNTRSKPSTWLNLLKLLVFLIRVRRSCAVSTIKLMYVPKN